MDRTFHEAVLQALALEPQSIAGDGVAVDGALVLAPAGQGRALVFAVAYGDPGDTNDSELSIAVEGTEDAEAASPTYEAVQDKDGNDLVFDTIAIVGTASGAAAGVVLGTVPIERLPYNGYRISVTNTNTKDAVIASAQALLVDVLDKPTGQLDGLLEKVLPDGTEF